MKIQIDIDGVLADFIGGFYETATRIDPSVNPGMFGYNTFSHKVWEEFPGVSEETEKATWGEIRKSQDFWMKLKPIFSGDEMELIHDLEEPLGNVLYFVTARSGETAWWQTVRWLKCYANIADPQVVITDDKAGMAKILDVDYAIEDRETHAMGIGKEIGSTRSYLVDRLYNRNINPTYVKRVKTLKQALEDIRAREAKRA